jgi:hypothetical protein
MWLRTVVTLSFVTVRYGMIPGVLDPSIDGKTLGTIESIMGHFVSVGRHSSTVDSQLGLGRKHNCVHRGREEV